MNSLPKKNCRVLQVLLCLMPALTAASMRANEPRLTDAQLAAKAQRLQRLVEERLLQAHGMIPMLVRADDYKLPTAKDYEGAYQHRHLRGKTEAELGLPPMHVWRAWENTPSDTAYYLHAMSYQCRVTGDSNVLAICRRTLGALKYIYSLGVEKGERGFLSKAYGGVYSDQTSGDQLQCVTWGLAAYRGIAPLEDRAMIDMMTRDFAAHQMETDYINLHGYFGRSAEDLRKEAAAKPWDWNKSIIYLPTLYLARSGNNDPKFSREIQRLNQLAEKQKPPRAATDKFKANGFGGRRNLYLSSLLMEFDPSHQKIWRDAMLSTFHQGRTGLLPDGTWPNAWSYDSKQGGMKPERMDSIGGGYGRTGRSVVYAMGCVAAQRWFPDEDMKGVARKILEGQDEKTFRFIMPLDEKNPLPPEWQVESKMLDTDCLTGWLCAYWEGRYRGHW